MRVRITVDFDVFDPEALRNYVYKVQHADKETEDVDDILQVDKVDNPVPNMVWEALVAPGNVAPLDIGVEIMDFDTMTY